MHHLVKPTIVGLGEGHGGRGVEGGELEGLHRLRRPVRLVPPDPVEVHRPRRQDQDHALPHPLAGALDQDGDQGQGQGASPLLLRRV